MAVSHVPKKDQIPDKSGVMRGDLFTQTTAYSGETAEPRGQFLKGGHFLPVIAVAVSSFSLALAFPIKPKYTPPWMGQR